MVVGWVSDLLVVFLAFLCLAFLGFGFWSCLLVFVGFSLLFFPPGFFYGFSRCPLPTSGNLRPASRLRVDSESAGRIMRPLRSGYLCGIVHVKCSRSSPVAFHWSAFVFAVCFVFGR